LSIGKVLGGLKECPSKFGKGALRIERKHFEDWKKVL
jgi:hypothetical protein